MSDWLYGILQGIFGSVLYELLLAGVVAALLAYLKAKRESLAGPALYGLAGFTMVMVIAFTIVGHAVWSKQQPETTTENIEANIHAWSDAFGLSITKEQPGPDQVFSYLIGLHSGRPVYVNQSKARDHYLQLQGTVALSKEHLDRLSKFTKAQQESVEEELKLELARSKIGYGMAGPPLKGVALAKAIPITSSLTEATFAGYLDEMDSAMDLSIETTRLSIERISH